MGASNREMLLLNIGDISVKLNCMDCLPIEDDFDEFLSEGKGKYDLLTLRVNKQASFSPQSQDLSVVSEKGLIVAELDGLKSYVNLNTFEGEINISSKKSFDTLLRYIYPMALIYRDGFCIHASSVVRNDKAYVFPGKSGAGKTTIACLSQDATFLGDDVSVVRKMGKEFIAYGSPFCGSFGVSGGKVSKPIIGSFFPVKSKENYVVKLGAKDALRKLLPNILLFGQDQYSKTKAFDLAYEFVSSISNYDLHFLRDSSFWKCIDEFDQGNEKQ